MKFVYSLLLIVLILLLIIFFVKQTDFIFPSKLSTSEVRELNELTKETVNVILRDLTNQHINTLARRTLVTGQRVETGLSSSTLNMEYYNNRVYKYEVKYQLNCPVLNKNEYDRLSGVIEILDDSSSQRALSMIKADLHFIGKGEDVTLSFLINNRGKKSVFINNKDYTEKMKDFIDDTASIYMTISRNLISQ